MLHGASYYGVMNVGLLTGRPAVPILDFIHNNYKWQKKKTEKEITNLTKP